MINRAMNQPTWLARADFQRATAFQGSVQATASQITQVLLTRNCSIVLLVVNYINLGSLFMTLLKPDIGHQHWEETSK